MTRKQIINHSFLGNSVILLQSPFSSTPGSTKDKPFLDEDWLTHQKRSKEDRRKRHLLLSQSIKTKISNGSGRKPLTLMARNQNDSNSTDDSSLSIRDEDILTLEGYTTIFANCEDTSSLSSRYEVLYRREPVRELLEHNKLPDRDAPINWLLKLPSKLFPNKNLKVDDYYNLAQIYSLLENIYRNALLRPYVPAYRTINIHCGRYRSFIEPYKNLSLERLSFEHTPPNQYTYKESDELYTIKYAIISGILMNRFAKDYKSVLNSSSSSC